MTPGSRPTALADDIRPPCGAKTRSGQPCRSAPVQGKRRCRMHGGAAGSGAPVGNRNALKSGLHTREAAELRRGIRNLIVRWKDIAASLG